MLFVALLGCGAAADSPPPATSAPHFAPEMRNPPRVRLTVRETAGVARSGEIVHNGVPLPREAGVRDPGRLAVVDASGRPVPADFQVLARWNAGLADREAPIQWLLVGFPASVGARKSAVYELVTDGSVKNPAPDTPLSLRRDGDRVTVETGAATFRLGGDAGAPFDEIRAGDRRLVSGGAMTLTTSGNPGKTGGHPARRRTWIEHAGPLWAAVVVQGAYDLPPVGKGGFGSVRRYVFTAGSPAVLLEQSVAWEGNLACQGCIVQKDGTPNGVRIERARDALALDLGQGARTATVIGRFAAPALERTLASGETAWVRQRLRPRRDAPQRFEVAAGPAHADGERADGGVLAISGPAGTVAAALDHPQDYEPQAVRLLEDGRLALDFADDSLWLAHHQGMFARMAVAALPPGKPARADLDRLVWAPLDRPLRAWPDAAWWNGSRAVGEIPAGKLPGGLAAYDDLVPAVLAKTVDEVRAEGLEGLMTFGLFPRYWGRWGSPEVACKQDPTPAEPWDDAFWCGTWTDYHNTLATAPLWAMRSGEVEWLDELSFPGARRMLHTQIMQCAPDDPWFYCGQAPAGYAGYRVDFNSSHAYFENLFLYYWLSGDSTVVATLRRGGDSMRRRMCAQREHGGAACAADVAPDKEGFTGRVGSQWLAALRFLGLASDDASFLDDWRSGFARALTHQYVEVRKGDRSYGFLGKQAPGKNGNTFLAGPIWMNAFYDAEGLYRLEVDTGDAALGDPPLRPSHVIAAVARTLTTLEPQAAGATASCGGWPQRLSVTWTGSRVGGTLGDLAPDGRELFGPERAGMAALLVRAGQDAGDPELLAAGKELVRYVLSASKGESVPLGKLQGQYLTRLHAAVARLARAEEKPERSK